MKTLLMCGVTLGIVACGGQSDRGEPETQPNTLSESEVADGWQLLFDGNTTNGWRGFGKETFPDRGWGVENGNLVVFESDGSEAGTGGDIVTESSFDDFELRLEFLLHPVANSGVFFRVVEHPDHDLWHVAPEFQVLDDTAYIDMGTMEMNTHLTGDNYDLHASSVDATKPLGEWNTMRIVANGPHIEHWLNGQKTVEYELWTEEWKAQVAASKFGEFPVYGLATSGLIGLQDHGHRVEFRNIKIRPL